LTVDLAPEAERVLEESHVRGKIVIEAGAPSA
jgi:hypothetical protein